MDKNAVQRKSVKGSYGTRREKNVKKMQLNVRISPTIMERLRKLSKAAGKSQAWIVEHAISQSLEFNE